MSLEDVIQLSLTGPGSHRLKMRPGVGVVIIGPKGSLPKPDLMVDPADRIDWSVFDSIQMSSGSLWPRRIVYRGVDTAVFAWADEGRPVEQLDFFATGPVDLDASESEIGCLRVVSSGHSVGIRLPSATRCRLLVLDGDPTTFSVTAHTDGAIPPTVLRLGSSPHTPTSVSAPRALPPMSALEALTDLSVENGPLDAPFDLGTLDQFPGLRRLKLAGSVTGLERLASRDLDALELRYIPDLAGLPSIATWPKLSTFIMWNCDAKASKLVTQELRRLPPTEHHRSVSQPRDRAWFIQEYGLPFSAWPARSAKQASAAFKRAAKLISAAKSEDAALAAVGEFTQAANQIDGLATTEREDLADAVHLLAGLSPITISEKLALRKFDAVRGF
ncbi:hypothetical protein ACFVTX_04990 [Agromyces sp. NPDC058136]|uniref:hypothetical protein n=1 Tax=Agromyces sp. NPDC058136 TaxID=3346354 RepID=UPI0036DBF02B